MPTKIYQSKKIYVFIILTWLSLVSVLAVIIVTASIQTAEESFKENSESLFHIVSDQTRTNETILEGFAASVSVIGKIDRDKIQNYAKQILNRYPHIFMFEVVEKVERTKLKQFEKNFRKKIYSEFKIKSFNYETTRNWQKVDKKSFYMPITFMEPFLDKSKNVLGLDLSSNEFLLDSLSQSKRLNSPVITDPFTLVEGDLAYLIQRPVEDKVNGKLAYNNNDVANRYVILVVLAKSLFKEKLSALQDLDVTLYHSKFDIKDVKGHLHTQSVNNKTFIETVLFPKLSLSLTLNSKTQPFILYLEKQLGWNILDWWLLSVLIIVGGISFYVLINYARVFHISEMNRMQEADHLFYLANHDSLTGLANRYLLMDRLKHALNQAKRSGSKLAVIFMDLDEFKPVNDIYGHDFGDKLLKSVSERLLACIRKGDTLARRSGDEFILVLESVEDDEKIKMVIEKIKDAFESNFKINQVELNVRMSIGFSIYPDDASDDDELLNIADQRMYKNKR